MPALRNWFKSFHGTFGLNIMHLTSRARFLLRLLARKETKEQLRSYCPTTYTVRFSLARRTQAHWLQGGQFREEKTSFQLEKRNALVKMKMPALNWLPFHLLTRGVCVMPFSVTTAVASLRFDPFFPMLGASIKSKLFISLFIWLEP